MDNILVTGTSGFVGQGLIKIGLAEKKQITGLDRTPGEAGIDFIECDLTQPEALEGVLAGRQFSQVIHLASLPGDTGDPQQMVRVNVNGCLNLLEAARRMKVQRFVLASSVSAYEWYPATKFNSPDYLPVDEKHPCRPKDMYSTTKRLQELLVQTYHYQYGLPTAILRFTAVIGPHGRGGGRGWKKFAESLATGKCVQIPHLTAEEVCHYVDARDVARMLLVAATHPRAVGEIFNCCGPSPTSGSEFIQAVQSVVPGIEVETGFPWSMAQGGALYFDMSKARQLLGFEPRYSLRESIQSIKDWIDAKGLEGEPLAAEDQAFGSGVAEVS
jgi:nucleoside-diphosphate-sugar epimerase